MLWPKVDQGPVSLSLATDRILIAVSVDESHRLGTAWASSKERAESSESWSATRSGAKTRHKAIERSCPVLTGKEAMSRESTRT